MLKFSELAEKIYKTDCIIIESTHESSILVHNHRKDSMTLLLSQAQPGLGWQFFFGIIFWRSLETRLNSVAKLTEFMSKPFLACVTLFATGSFHWRIPETAAPSKHDLKFLNKKVWETCCWSFDDLPSLFGKAPSVMLSLVSMVSLSGESSMGSNICCSSSFSWSP